MVYGAYVSLRRTCRGSFFVCCLCDRSSNWLSSRYDTPIENCSTLFSTYFSWYLVPFCSREAYYFRMAIFYELVQAYAANEPNLHTIVCILGINSKNWPTCFMNPCLLVSDFVFDLYFFFILASRRDPKFLTEKQNKTKNVGIRRGREA